MSFATIPEMFYKVCEKYGDSKTAYMYKKDGIYINVNYNELREKVECFALGLMELGIRSGDRVGIISENRIEWVISDLAIALIGAVDVPIFPILTSKQEEYIYNDCSASAIIVSNNFQLNKVMEFKDNVSSIRHVVVINEQFESEDVSVKSMQDIIRRGNELRSSETRRKILEETLVKILPDDLLTLIYTSGTTGDPKGVMLTHKNIVSNMQAILALDIYNDKETLLSFLPLCHSYERTGGYYSPFAAGCQSIGIFSYREVDAENPRAIIGLTDLSSRKYVRNQLGRDLLSFSVPFKMFLEMEGNVKGSFLERPLWKELIKDKNT